MVDRAVESLESAINCLIPILGTKMPKMGMRRPAALRKGRAANTSRTRRASPQATSLTDALFSNTQQRVLALLFGQPERSFFATELIRLARSGSGAVQRELRRLEQSGLITVSQQGNQKHYQANSNAPIFSELRSIVLKTVGLAEPLKTALGSIGRDIKLAALYGSTAKGNETAISDVDLLIVADELTLEALYTAIAHAERQLARKINPTLYTTEEFRRRRTRGDSFLTKVLSGPHIVLVGDEHAAAAP
jgi:predicted nucleotidyltransferase